MTLTVLCYAILAGVAQSLAVVALQAWHRELRSGIEAIRILPLLMTASLAAFVLAGWALSRVLPLRAVEIRFALLTLGLCCSLVPVARLPYDLVSQAAVRCALALLTCALMLTGARQPKAALRRSAPE